MKNNINYRLRKLSHGLSSVGIVAVMLGTTVPFSTANVTDNLNPEYVAQATETNEEPEKYETVYLGDINLPFGEQKVSSDGKSSDSDTYKRVLVGTNDKTTREVPFKTTYMVSNELEDGQEVVHKEGKNGIEETWKIHSLNAKTGEILDDYEQVGPFFAEGNEVVNEVIAMNLKTLSEKGLYETVYKPDLNLEFGETKVEQEGKAAIVQNGQVVKDPVEEVVKVGTQKTIKTTVPFETEYKVNNELKDGEQKVVQKGKNGVKETWEFYKVNTSTGEIGEKTSENPPKYISNDDKPVKEIIEVNSKTLSEIENGKPPVPPKQNESDDKESDNEQTNKEQSDKEQSDKEQSDKEQSDKEQSDKEQSDKEQSDKEQSDKEQSDKEQSDKEQSDKEQSDKEQSDKEQSDKEQSDKEQSDNEQTNKEQSDKEQSDKEQSDDGSINVDKKEKNKESSIIIGDKQSDKTDKQTDKQNKDKDIKVEIGEPYMPKELEEQIERSNQEIKQSIEEKQSQLDNNNNNNDKQNDNVDDTLTLEEDNETIIEENEGNKSPSQRDNDDTLTFEENDETIIKENEGKQSPSERDSNDATETVYDSSDVTKEQKQGQPELAETGIQKNNRLALLGIAGIGIVIAGLFFFISRRDKK